MGGNRGTDAMVGKGSGVKGRMVGKG